VCDVARIPTECPQYTLYINFVMNRSPVKEEELAGLRLNRKLVVLNTEVRNESY
jgi:hypothetical protein